jgi:hypothetical protein
MDKRKYEKKMNKYGYKENEKNKIKKYFYTL